MIMDDFPLDISVRRVLSVLFSFQSTSPW